MRRKKTPRQKIVKKLDKIIRELVLKRDGACVRCGNTENLQLSHVRGRRNVHLRWNMNNLKMLCVACHLYWWHKEVLEAAKWFNDKYPGRAEYLDKEANRQIKYSVADLEEMYEELKNLNKPDLLNYLNPKNGY